MFNLDIFQIINSVTIFLTQRIKTITNIFENSYAELTNQAREVARALTYPQPIKWEYVIDATTGLKILKAEKDSKALERVRQMADELFK
jgi:hypothetical protein